MTASAIFILAIVAGVVQAFGYNSYLERVYRDEIEPEPTTWFMFGYGTVILTLLEWDKGANLALLLQPLVCAYMGLQMAFRLLRSGKVRWPENKLDQIALISDMLLTIVYVASKVAQSQGHLSESTTMLLLTVFLVCSNASGVVSFIPILRNTKKYPRLERPTPWIIWGVSYLLLGVSTYLKYGWFSVFMIYPVLNTFLHLVVAVLSLGSRQQSARNAPSL